MSGDDVCACGHFRAWHGGMGLGVATFCKECRCRAFRVGPSLAFPGGGNADRHAPPVALADHGNDCVDCGRPIPVTEPVHRASAGRGFRCAACDAAVPEPAPAPLPPPADLVTSALMRRAAQLLDRSLTASAAYSDEFKIIAHELRARAELLQRLRDITLEHANDVGLAVLQAIGEVRS